MSKALRDRIGELSRRERHVIRKVQNVPEDVGLADFIEREPAELDQRRADAGLASEIHPPRAGIAAQRLADLKRILRENSSG
jgi:hypothetical protein